MVHIRIHSTFVGAENKIHHILLWQHCMLHIYLIYNFFSKQGGWITLNLKLEIRLFTTNLYMCYSLLFLLFNGVHQSNSHIFLSWLSSGQQNWSNAFIVIMTQYISTICSFCTRNFLRGYEVTVCICDLSQTNIWNNPYQTWCIINILTVNIYWKNVVYIELWHDNGNALTLILVMSSECHKTVRTIKVS